MLASAAGHTETAVVLARWSAGTQTEAGARQASTAARRAGHIKLATMLDRIHPPPKDGVFVRPHGYVCMDIEYCTKWRLKTKFCVNYKLD